MKKFDKNINIKNIENLVGGLVNIQDIEIVVSCTYHRKDNNYERRDFCVNPYYGYIGENDVKCSTLRSALNKAKKYMPTGELDEIRFSLIGNKKVEISMGDWTEYNR